MSILSFEETAEYICLNCDQLIINNRGRRRKYSDLRVEKCAAECGMYATVYGYDLCADDEHRIMRFYEQEYEVKTYEQLRMNFFSHNLFVGVRNDGPIPELVFTQMSYMDYVPTHDMLGRG